MCKQRSLTHGPTRALAVTGYCAFTERNEDNNGKQDVGACKQNGVVNATGVTHSQRLCQQTAKRNIFSVES